MSEIGGIQTSTYTNTITPGAGPTSNTPVGPGATGVNSAALLAEIQRLAALLAVNQSSGTTPGVPGVTTAGGAPEIGGVQINFSPEDMAAALLVLKGKTQEAQLATAKEGLITNKKKLEEKNAQAMEKINDWIKKCEEASSKEKAAGIFGWITKIAGFIAAALAVAVAAVATVATGGAAAPLLAFAVLGMVGATMSLASQISQSCGGPALELSTLVVKACTGILEACGVPKEKAEAAGKMMSGMAMMVCPALLMIDPGFAGNFAGGFAQLCGADASQAAIVSAVFTAVAAIGVAVAMVVATGGAGAIEGIAEIAVAAGRIGQAAAGVTAGVAGITQGALNMAKAGDERDAAVIQSDKKLVDAMIAKLQKQMEDDREDIKKVMQEMMDGINMVTQMIAAAGQSHMQIAANLSGKGNTI